MNEAFEKILERLEEKLKKSEERYHRYLDDGNLSCMFDRSDIEEKRVDTIKEMIEIVHEVAEEYKGGWIPCSERLPEIDGNTSDTVLVCGSNGFLYMAFWCDDLQWRFCECGMAKEPVLWTEIVAWQPLPEPYKERD